MGNDFDFSQLSENLSKEIDEVIEAETAKAMEEAVDTVMKASEADDEELLSKTEETAKKIETEESATDKEPSDTPDAADISGSDSEDAPEITYEVPVLDFSSLDFGDDDDEEEATHQLDTMFDDVNAALAEQVERHLGPSFAELLDEEEGDDGDDDSQEEKNGGVPKWLKIVIGILLFLVLLGAFLLFTRPGQKILTRAAAKFVIGKTNTENPDDVREIGDNELGDGFVDHSKVTPNPEKTDNTENPQVTSEPTVTGSPSAEDEHPVFEEDSTVINILLIGEENYYKDFRGRSDSMMVASLDKDGGPVKLVSFMRDLYVEIPGHDDNKLNAAYSLGGAPLLVQTLEKNFGLKIDGYVIVQYEGFEKIVDKLGGLEISLTQEEAEYLNRTDYISKPEQRNVVAGNQKMTGSQVLGYCRVRKVNTANGLYADYGRTYRQRLVLNKIFDKYKSKNISELYSIMNECLKYVTVSEGIDEVCAECLQIVVENKMFDLEQFRIPYEDKNGRHFTSTKIGGQEVLCFYPDNAILLHNFLYGEEDNE